MTINYGAIDSLLTSLCGSNGTTSGNCKITPTFLPTSIDLYQLIIDEIGVFSPQIDAISTNLTNINNSITSSINYAANGFVGTLPFTPFIVNIPSLDYTPLDNISLGCGINGVTNNLCKLSATTLYPEVDLYQFMVDIVEIVEEKIPALETNIEILNEYANNLYDYATNHYSVTPPIFPCIPGPSHCTTPVNPFELLDNLFQLECGSNGINNGKCLISPSTTHLIDIYELALDIIETSNDLGVLVKSIILPSSLETVNDLQVPTSNESNDLINNLPDGFYLVLF